MQASFVTRLSAPWLLIPFWAALILVLCQQSGANLNAAATLPLPATTSQATAPVAGQVFVIAPSGESLRLGSVRVQVFAEETILAHLEVRDRELGGRLEKLHERRSRLEDTAREQATAVAAAEKAYSDRDAEIRAELQEYIEQVEEERAFILGKIESNAEFIASKDLLPAPPEGIPSREEFEAYEKRRKKWLSMSRAERANWAAVLASLNLELEEELRKLSAAREEKVFAYADELQVLDERIIALKKEAEAFDQAVASVKREIRELPDSAHYLTDLPAPVDEIRTDAGGEFSLDLPRDQAYVIFAQAARHLGGETVEFKWFVRTGENRASRIILSDHNLITSDASENVINLSSLADESKT